MITGSNYEIRSTEIFEKIGWKKIEIILKVPISLAGSLRIGKEHKKLVNKFFNLFLFSSIVSEI